MTAMPTWRPDTDVVIGGGMKLEVVIRRHDGTEGIFPMQHGNVRSANWTASEHKAQACVVTARNRNPGCRVFIRAVGK